MTSNLELFLNELPNDIPLKKGIYLYYSTYVNHTLKKFTPSQKNFILKKYDDPLTFESALKIIVNLPENMSFSKIIKSIDYNLEFRKKFKNITFKKEYTIKKATFTSPHDFYNGTQYDLFYKNELIANFNFVFSYEKNNLTLRLKNMQGVKGKGTPLSVLSSKLKQDWMEKLLSFLKTYSEAKKIKYVFEMPPKYNTATEKEYKRYAFENYLKKYLKKDINLSKIDFKKVPKEFFPEVKEIISKYKLKKIKPKPLLNIKRKSPKK